MNPKDRGVQIHPDCPNCNTNNNAGLIFSIFMNLNIVEFPFLELERMFLKQVL